MLYNGSGISEVSAERNGAKIWAERSGTRYTMLYAPIRVEATKGNGEFRPEAI